MGERPGFEPPRRQAVEHDVHRVPTGKDDPPIAGELAQRGAEGGGVEERLDADGRRGDHFRAELLQRADEVTRLLARARHHDPAPCERPGLSCHTGLQSHRPENHYQAMVRDALIRFALRRAARSGAGRPADLWLRLACAWSPGFGPPFAALVEPRRAPEDRLRAMSAAQAATPPVPPHAPPGDVPGGADPRAVPLEEAPPPPQTAVVPGEP